MTERTDGPSTTRRRLLGATGGALAGGYLLSARTDGATGDATQSETPTATPTPPESVWPLFQFDQRNTGHAPDVDGPERAAGASWAHVDGGQYTTTPVVTDSEVFVADGGAGVVRALDAFTGAERWSRDLSTNNARMTIQDRTLYVPTTDTSAEFQALDPEDGSRKWGVNLGSTPTGIVTGNNTAYVSTVGGVVAVSLLAKDVSWQYDGVSLFDTTIAAVGSSLYVAGTTNGKVAKVNTADGGTSWSNILEGGATGAPTVVDRTVYAPVDEALVALSEGTGTEEWRYEAPVGSSVAVADGTAYGTTTGGEAFAVDVANGSEVWRTAVGAGSNPPVVAGGVLYVTGTDGTVAALNPRDGSAIWSTDVGAAVGANPAVFDGDLYLADGAGRMAKLAPGASGAYDTPTPTSSPTPSESPTPSGSPTPTTLPPLDDTEQDLSDPQTTATPTPSARPTATDDTDGGGGIDLPLVGGGVAAVLALAGGALWWRGNSGDDYDPLG
jgi:outer membrane protein assembly factor BamB